MWQRCLSEEPVAVVDQQLVGSQVCDHSIEVAIPIDISEVDAHAVRWVLRNARCALVREVPVAIVDPQQVRESLGRCRTFDQEDVEIAIAIDVGQIDIERVLPDLLRGRTVRAPRHLCKESTLLVTRLPARPAGRTER